MGAQLGLVVILAAGCTPGSSSTRPADTSLATADSGAAPARPAFTIRSDGGTTVATSAEDPRLVIEVDCDDEADDDRYFGIAPVLDGLRYEIPMYGGPRFPIFTPDFDAGEISCGDVTSDATALVVRLEAGSYATLVTGSADVPVPLEAVFTVEDGRLVARLSGLYYVMPTRADTTLDITHGVVESRTITAESEAFSEDFDGVTALAVHDSLYGELTIDADIARLQVQLYDDGSEGFELDLDHSFKDLGQMSVSATVTFP